MNSDMSSSQQSRRQVAAASGMHGTPESEFSIEGFCQNYTPSEVFIQGLTGMVNQSDVESMIRAQKQMLQRFEKTNEMILNCNALSQSRLKTATDDFKRHVKLLSDMKKDLDYIFRKVRVIKNKVAQQYPEAYAEAQPHRSSLAEEAEDDGEVATSSSASAKESTQKETSASAEPPAEAQETQQKPANVDPKTSTTGIEYVQMEEAIDNGKPIENELIKRVCSIELANPNDSSDCTSEDTG